MINRIYSEIFVSHLTLNQIDKIISDEQLAYSGDFGLKNDIETKLIFSLN
ncbi:MAG: hypothetical protein KatS3mg002_1422 [Candidatus Woesearchaeota archaeon]|nr:MAG: hypothetical protein KatS3mg002_1422 [Candidatus Woesearchaeota archaeon]